MISISLCMIVKNEEEALEECLSSIHKVCDEIVIVDTGSSDRTKEIAFKYTNNVYDFKWCDDFSAARNFSFNQATMDYILWLDADDVFLKKDQEKLQILKEQLDFSVDSVSMNYILQFDEFGKPSFYFRRNRLVKRSNNFKWVGPVHEYLEVSGNIIQSDIAVVHQKDKKKQTNISTDRNLKIYERRLRLGEEFTPRDLYYYANELKDHQNHEKAITYYQKFLSTNKGWIEDKIRACLYMADSYQILGNEEKAIKILLRSFIYDRPRPETCCRLGDYFKDKRQFETALFWYQVAINNKVENPQGFHYEAYSTWYPHLSLTVCYWELGDFEKAIEHNEIVAKDRPNDPRVLFNKRFFNEFIQKYNNIKRWKSD